MRSRLHHRQKARVILAAKAKASFWVAPYPARTALPRSRSPPSTSSGHAFERLRVSRGHHAHLDRGLQPDCRTRPALVTPYPHLCRTPLDVARPARSMEEIDRGAISL